MSEMKHTPGPWKAFCGALGLWAVEGIAVVTGRKRQPENEANARLIAAAPELLEACKSVIAGCVHPEKAIRAVMVNLEPIRAAIAKAEGREP